MIAILRLRKTWLVPVVALTTGACFATRGDVRILQSDIERVREEMTTNDSAVLSKLDTELARIAAMLAEVTDTVRSTNIVMARFGGDVREDLRSIQQQLITIQELTGQSQRRIQELRTELEARPVDQAVQPTQPSATPGNAGEPTVAAVPGPSQLIQMGHDQLRRGSPSAARAAYTQLLETYPASDQAPEALYGIADTWADEGNGVAADSVYALVVERFPRSDKAPTALYKRATAFRVVGQTAQARALYQEILDRYPRSDAALLAQDFLRANP